MRRPSPSAPGSRARRPPRAARRARSARNLDARTRAADRDRAEEHRVEQHEERQQRARGGARAHAGLSQRPQRQRRAADAGGRQQPRRGRAAQRDLHALARSHPRRRTAGDEPQQRDVAGEREHLEHRRRGDPPRVGIDRTAQGVGKRLHRATSDDECARDGGEPHGRQRSTPTSSRRSSEGRAKSAVGCMGSRRWCRPPASLDVTPVTYYDPASRSDSSVGGTKVSWRYARAGAVARRPQGRRGRFRARRRRAQRAVHVRVALRREGPGSNPEELIGAAQAACYAMQLAAMLGEAGTPADSIRATAQVELRFLDDTPTITKIAIEAIGDVPGITQDQFTAKAQEAKQACLITRALAAVPEITLDATAGKRSVRVAVEATRKPASCTLRSLPCAAGRGHAVRPRGVAAVAPAPAGRAASPCPARAAWPVATRRPARRSTTASRPPGCCRT